MRYDLILYELDGETVDRTFSTGGVGEPWLKVPEFWADAEIDFTTGSSSIGEITLEVIDPQDGATQAVRGLTDILRDGDGRSALLGRRMDLFANDGTARLLFCGVVHRVELSDSLASFILTLRDIREREREVELFKITTTPTILPAGVLDGYGVPYPGAPQSEWLVPPTKPLVGTVRAVPLKPFVGQGILGVFVDLDEYVIGRTGEGVPVVRDEVVISQAGARALTEGNLRLLWRPEGSSGAFQSPTPFNAFGTSSVVTWDSAVLGSSDGPEVIAARRIPFGFLASPAPSANDRVEIIVQYVGPPSADFPLHIEGVTLGEFLKDIYDGVYTAVDPFAATPPPSLGIDYDESAVLAMTTPVRARITAPVTDAREWIESNIYVTAGAAPAIVGDKVRPVYYELPDANETLIEITDAEAEVSPGWAHSGDDAINAVAVTYSRDRSVAPGEPGFSDAAGDRIVSRDIVRDRRNADSIGLFGLREQEYRLEVVRAVGGPQGEPYSGDVADEAGDQVAQRIAAGLLDRFAFGAQTFVVTLDPNAFGAGDLDLGRWVKVSTSWIPNYTTGDRGGPRVGQIVGVREIGDNRTELLVIDGGPDVQPLAPPTLGTLAENDLGQVEVPITTVPSGAEARVDFAIGFSQPAADSGLWTFAGRAEASETILTPPMPTGLRVWIRSRSEAVQRRPSAYTTPVSIDIAPLPRVRKVFGFVLDDAVEVHWRANSATAGVRIEYVAHQAGEVPDYGEGDTVDVGSSPAVLTDAFDRSPGQVLSFRVTPFDFFGGGSVSGDQGVPLEGSVFIGVPDDVPFGYVIGFLEGLNLEFQAQGNQLARGGKWAVKLDEPPTEPDDPNAEATGEFEGPFTIEQLTLSTDPDYDDVWIAVFFFDDYDESADEPIGKRGPRVLGRAIRQIVVPPRDPDVSLISGEVNYFGEGTGADFSNRQVKLTIAISDAVASVRTLWGPVEATGSPIEGSKTFDVTPATFSTLTYFVGAEPTDSDDAVQFPDTYPVDTEVTIQVFSQSGADGFLQDVRFRFGPDTQLPIIRTTKATTAIQGSSLRIGTGLSLQQVSDQPEIALDSAALNIQLGDIKDAGDGSGTGRIVVATSNGANTIVGPSAAGQVLQSTSAGVNASYTWGTVTTGVTSISANDGLDGGGTGAVNLAVDVYGGFEPGVGHTVIQDGKVGVKLGSTSANEALPGNTNIPQGTVTSVSGGAGLTGTVTTSGSIAMGTPSTISATSDNGTTATSHTHELDENIADVRVEGSAPTSSDVPARAGSLWFVV